MSVRTDDAGVRWPLSTTVAATGVGSLPGTDPVAASRFVLDEAPDLPYLPELPARGPWAGMTGRTGALLVDLPVELEPAGWRLASHVGPDLRRAASLVAEDLDLFAASAEGFTGVLKIAAAGPLTLAATLDLHHGDKILGDAGARRELTESLAEGVAAYVADVERRLPGARVVLQLDEPAARAVLDGTVPTRSGFDRFRAVPAAAATEALARVVRAAAVPVVVHCCAARVPFDVLVGAGAQGVSYDLSLLGSTDDELAPQAAAVDAGVHLVVGALPAVGADAAAVTQAGTIDGARRRVAEMWRRLGGAPGDLAAAVSVSPACGLAGATAAYARAVTAATRDLARALTDDPTP